MVDVEVSVPVVIEEGNAAPVHLDDPVLLPGAAAVDKRDARLRGDVLEDDIGRSTHGRYGQDDQESGHDLFHGRILRVKLVSMQLIDHPHRGRGVQVP